MERDFLPISREDLLQRGWYYYDFLLITGDAYVDHPSFGMAIVSRASNCGDTPRIVALLEQFGLPTRTDYSADDLFSYTLSDKKRSGGTVNLIIPRAIGDCVIVPTKVESLKSFIQAGL